MTAPALRPLAAAVRASLEERAASAAVARAAEEVTAPKLSEAETEARVADLARLKPMAYARQRATAAAQLGVGVAALDSAVKKAAKQARAHDDSAMFPPVEPWPNPVDGAALLTSIGEAIRAHVVADRPTIVAAALWAAHTYLLDHLTISPIANITAPEMRCGKTVLLSVLGLLAWRPLQAANISPAAIYRAVEKWGPTLLIDEADSFLRDNEELRGILNSGHTRTSAYVLRCVGDEFEPQRFSTWGAKALSGIGAIPPTLADRSVQLVLRRKLPSETVANLRHSPPGIWAHLRQKLVRWTQDHAADIAAARPSPVAGLGDRANDNFEPLLAVAEAAGGHWPKLAREAATRLCGQPDGASGADELLAAIRDAFDHAGMDRLPTAALLEALCADSEGPWATWNRGKPISPRQIARKLSDYKIRPITFRMPNGTTPKGYAREDFADAWLRYLPSHAHHPALSATPQHVSNGAASGAFLSATGSAGVADAKPLQPAPALECCGVADDFPLGGMPCDDGPEPWVAPDLTYEVNL